MGVEISNDLKFNDYISNIVTSASMMVGWAMIAGMEGTDYIDRLASLGMYSQERRRERYQVIFIWKICQGLVHGSNLEFTSMTEEE